MYTDLVMDHFSNPRNVGEVADADGVGQVGNPVCGDIMRITIKVVDDAIEDAKFKTFGCGAAVATSSMVTEMVMGKTLTEAAEISNRAVAEALGGLPPIKMHCSNLAADALHLAIADYLTRSGREDEVADDRRAAARGRRSRARRRRGRLRPDDGVLVALSGGVDSAVALLRLAAAGRRVEAAIVKLWPGDDPRSCCGPTAIARAQAAADAFGVRLHVLDEQARFARTVVEPFVAAYLGRRDSQPLRALQSGAPGGARRPCRRAGPGARRDGALRASGDARGRALGRRR